MRMTRVVTIANVSIYLSRKDGQYTHSHTLLHTHLFNTHNIYKRGREASSIFLTGWLQFLEGFRKNVIYTLSQLYI